MKLTRTLGGFLALLPVTAWALQPLVTDDTGTQIEAAYNRTTDKASV